MIDTIRFRIPLTKRNKELFNLISCNIITFSPEGDILRENRYFIPDFKPTSSFDNLYIKEMGKYLYFEFSLHKYINRKRMKINYNHNNYTLRIDYEYFDKFIMALKEFGFEIEEIELMRVDIGLNYKFNFEMTIEDFFELLYLQLSKVGKIRSNQFRTSVYYPSRWVTKKFYSKGHELKNLINRNKLNRKVYEQLQKKLLNEKVIRLELSLKSEKLKSLRVKKYNDKTFHKIKEYFDNEAINILKFTSFEIRQSILTLKEKELLNLVKENGYNLARDMFINKYSRRTFFRVQKAIKEKGINIKSIIRDNIDDVKITKYEITYTLEFVA